MCINNLKGKRINNIRDLKPNTFILCKYNKGNGNFTIWIEFVKSVVSLDSYESRVIGVIDDGKFRSQNNSYKEWRFSAYDIYEVTSQEDVVAFII